MVPTSAVVVAIWALPVAPRSAKRETLARKLFIVDSPDRAWNPKLLPEFVCLALVYSKKHRRNPFPAPKNQTDTGRNDYYYYIGGLASSIPGSGERYFKDSNSDLTISAR